MTDDNEKLASLGMPVEIAKQNLRDDPETHEIAQALGVDVEDYIEQVIHYAQRPHMDAQVQVIPDEELAEMGADAPSLDDVKQWFQDVHDGNIDLAGPKVVPETESYTEEKDETEAKREAVGGHVERVAPTPEQLKGEIKVDGGAVGSILKRQLLDQQRRLSMNRDVKQAAKDKKTRPGPPKKKKP